MNLWLFFSVGLIWNDLPKPSHQVRLPEAIGKAVDIECLGEDLYVLDPSGPGIYYLNSVGKIIQAHTSKGFGPGELQSPVGFTSFNHRLYLGDLKRSVILSFDRDLNFLGEKKSHGLMRDLAVTGDAFFVVTYRPGTKNNGIIHKYDRNMELLKSFGTSLPDTDLNMGFHAGTIHIFEDRLYFLHIFIFQIEVFDLDGNLVATHAPPGYKGRTLLDHLNINKPNWWNKPHEQVIGFELTPKGAIAASLWDQANKKSSLWVYKNQSSKWSRFNKGLRLVGVNERFLISRTRDDDDLVQLQFWKFADIVNSQL